MGFLGFRGLNILFDLFEFQLLFFLAFLFQFLLTFLVLIVNFSQFGILSLRQVDGFVENIIAPIANPLDRWDEPIQFSKILRSAPDL
jgi:hypothetical protein